MKAFNVFYSFSWNAKNIMFFLLFIISSGCSHSPHSTSSFRSSDSSYFWYSLFLILNYLNAITYILYISLFSHFAVFNSMIIIIYWVSHQFSPSSLRRTGEPKNMNTMTKTRGMRSDAKEESMWSRVDEYWEMARKQY